MTTFFGMTLYCAEDLVDYLPSYFLYFIVFRYAPWDQLTVHSLNTSLHSIEDVTNENKTSWKNT